MCRSVGPQINQIESAFDAGGAGGHGRYSDENEPSDLAQSHVKRRAIQNAPVCLFACISESSPSYFDLRAWSPLCIQ